MKRIILVGLVGIGMTIILGCNPTRNLAVEPNFSEEIVLPTILSDIEYNPVFAKGTFTDNREDDYIAKDIKVRKGLFQISLVKVDVKPKNEMENIFFQGLSRLFETNGYEFLGEPNSQSFIVDINLEKTNTIANYVAFDDKINHEIEFILNVNSPNGDKQIFSNTYSCSTEKGINNTYYGTDVGYNVEEAFKESVISCIKRIGEEEELISALNSYITSR